ncbi:hypothetical protein JVT61DRAFT_6105 [Boletus reticuloceps]|uniref:DUF6830 domain-containing protein n=1 Tax=Boletus reticuloceps TaxID=495285 RepID=A0A8I2YMN7_9AGAM|nr:hypothetical protein JVT61DRAFT_6105 [Boletus reticuloceps]
MYECPYCLKQFQTRQGVTCHVRQPLRRCRAWQNDLVPVAEVLDREWETPPSSPAFFPDIPESPMQVDATVDNLDYKLGGHNVNMKDDQCCQLPTIDSEENGYSVMQFEGAAQTFEGGEVFLNRFNMDTYLFQCKQNIYYPFATEKEWKLAKYLLCSPLSMAQIDEFFKLDAYHVIPTEHPTTTPVYLYYRDTLDCIKLLFNHPYFLDKMDLSPQRVYKTTEGVVEHVYSEWLTGDAAWRMQSELPPGSMLLGVILSSDKTNITSMTGGHVAHPLLISLANIPMKYCNKASNHAFSLATLLPVTKFIHENPRICTVLNDQLIHHCLDIVFEPLKQAARIGRMMSDPSGNLHLCYTPLASYIVDTPEAAMLACVRGLTSHVTMAMYKNFRDSFCHPPRLGQTMLHQLASITVDPHDVKAFFRACEEFRLNEHAHIELIKNPAKSSNKKDYDSQICCYLDRHKKCRTFNNAVILTLAESDDTGGDMEDRDLEDEDCSDIVEPEESHIAAVLSDLWGPNRQATNFFEKAAHNKRADNLKIWPPRSFVRCSTAIHLNYNPSHRWISIDEAVELFSLPDLRSALTDYFSREGLFSHNIRQARPTATHSSLPFNYLQLWFKVRLQQKSFHADSVVGPTLTVNTSPPIGPWKYGHYDAAIFAVDESQMWPRSGLTGHIVAQVRMIFHPIPPNSTRPTWANRYLTYMQPFDIQNNGAVDPTTHMHILKHKFRSAGIVKGDILPLDHICSYVHIVPKFGKQANSRLTSFNSLHFADTFYLNHYFDKDFFYVVST